ncbi:hypothetical protein FGO68_gene2916 [Halteria grandinella]|uniref:histidine kinase n=1 Tax=Halteria grandinella TaxID=5974 RepID=A0A8J8NW08_HALGN|nr:hypothetical protein FGO68_gene2916 [Halteria grandinella]
MVQLSNQTINKQYIMQNQFLPSHSHQDFDQKRKSYSIIYLRHIYKYGLIVSLASSIASFYNGNSIGLFYCIFTLPILLACFIFKHLIDIGTKRSQNLEKYLPLSVGLIMMICMTEEQIYLSPQKFSFNLMMLTFIGVENHCSILVSTATRRERMIQRTLVWAYFLVRNYSQYGGNLPPELVPHVIVFLIMQNKSTRVTQECYDSIKMQKTRIEETFQQTLDLIPHGIIIFDTNSGQVKFGNTQIIEQSNKGEAIGKEINDNINSLIESSLKEYKVEQVLTGLSDFSSFSQEEEQTNFKSPLNLSLWDIINNSKEGIMSEGIFKVSIPKRYLQISTSLIKNSTQAFIFCTDITRMKHVERQHQRMRSTFFTSVAHELRTPLNSINPILQMLIDLIRKGERTQTMPQNAERMLTYLKIVMNSAIHLQNVIEDALDISRIENNKFSMCIEQFSVEETVHEVAEVMMFQTEQKGLKLEVKVAAEVPLTFLSDRKRYKQVLFNLIGNAIKFTFSGSIKIEVSQFEGKLITRVKDTGLSMSSDQLKKLFRFFGTIKDYKDINRGGMGLGLTISKMIVESLGGEISVSSTPDQGSEFQFHIPSPNQQCIRQQQICKKKSEKQLYGLEIETIPNQIEYCETEDNLPFIISQPSIYESDSDQDEDPLTQQIKHYSNLLPQNSKNFSRSIISKRKM